jgi:hypothetical protein
MQMYEINQLIEIVNHSEPACNGQLGTITNMQVAYDGYTYYYDVLLEDSEVMCVCTDDEIMEA